MWTNSLQIYIEPKTRQSKKDALKFCEGIISSYQYSIIDNLAEVHSSNLPLIIIFEQDTESKFEAYKSQPNSFLIQFYQANLDLFQTQKIEDDCYIVESGLELRDTLKNVHQLIVSSLNILMYDYVELALPTLKKIFNKKNREKIKNYRFSPKQKEFDRELYEQDDLDDIIALVQEKSVATWGGQFRLLQIEEVLKENILTNYLPLKVGRDLYLFLTWEGDLDFNVIMANYETLQECIVNHGVVYDSKLKREKKEQLLSGLTLPIVIFDEAGEVLIHNRSFIGLNMGTAECLKLSDGDQITLQKNIYRIIRTVVNCSNTKFLFIPVNDFILESRNPSFEELGIISSSIAHELNNPLAGVSAALDFLLIDDCHESMVEELQLMKKGVNRCRGLVDTFLGFSRSVQNIHGEEQVLRSDLELNINQALELIRFRLIENNINIQVEYQQSTKFVKDVNPHIMTMFLYLLLGDIVTTMSHTSLVTRKKITHLKILLKEDVDEIILSYSEEIIISDQFLNSKLVLHLLDLLKLDLIEDEGAKELRLK